MPDLHFFPFAFPIYFLTTASPVANAVITEVKGDRAALWLGGVDLAAVDNGTVFTVINGKGKVTLQSRDGLVGVATVEGLLKKGCCCGRWVKSRL